MRRRALAGRPSSTRGWLAEGGKGEANRVVAERGAGNHNDVAADHRHDTATGLRLVLRAAMTESLCDNATRLANAAWRSHESAVKERMAAEAKVRTPTCDGRTTLHAAVWPRSAPVIRLLVCARANGRSVQQPPLEQAVFDGNVSVVRVLVRCLDKTRTANRA
jgi:hypothetical protein